MTSHGEPHVLSRTPRTTLKRHAERGSYDRAALDAILDEALVCHAAVSIDGVPHVLPTAHVRIGDFVYLHGARANHLLVALAAGAPSSVAVTLLDGLVLARSAFSHSMNFRCAVLFGVFEEVVELAEKALALTALIEHMAPGRSSETRAPDDSELRTTLVVKLEIREGSVKVRKGPPLDAAEDTRVTHWAGEIPLRLVADAPRADPRLPAERTPGTSVLARARSFGAPANDLEPVYEVKRGALCVSCDRGRLDFPFVHRFLAEESYWAQGVSPELQRRSMQNALCFGLYEGASQLGFARVVTDYGRLAYLGDVFVTASARGRGLGTWLVECVLAHPALAGVERWLLGTADAHSLYARFGFVPAHEGRYMVRRS